MRAYDIIRKKRDGFELSEAELSFIINKYVSGNIPDYQVSALLMAIFFRGMTDAETLNLTKIMLNSGCILDLSDIRGPKIDKHSTGGVGDKTSMILAPLLASAGIIVPMISGRGLGHTGGTLDKLEAIPGFRIDLNMQEFKGNLKNIGVSMIGQTSEIVPADGKLYALRDVSATVESIPLIASSIISKKLAEGIDGLVLDVKVGSGAFMKKLEDARRLAATMVNIGSSMGVKTVAVLTDMDQPLGKTIGNSLEIKECISALRGQWADDLREVTLTLGAWMIETATMVSDFSLHIGGTDFRGIDEYKNALLELLNNGAAFKKFAEMVDAQHGNPEIAFRLGLLPSAKMMKQITVTREGYIQRLDAEKAGIASMLLGAGRQKKEDAIDHSAGMILNKKVGDHVKPGDQTAMFYYNNEANLKEAEDIFLSGIEVGIEEPVKKGPVLGVIY